MEDQQARRRVVESLDRSLFIEASAGTGKTHELIRRAVTLLAAGQVDVDRMAIVTFTEKAAGELKLRIRQALDLARRAPERSPAERDRLEGAIARLEEATIDTIHGFCRVILRAHPLEAGVDPSFYVDGHGGRLLSLAFRQWFTAQLAQPSASIRRFLARGRVRRPGQTPSGELEDAVRTFLDHRDLDAPWPRPEVEPVSLWSELEPALRALAERAALGDAADPLRVSLQPWLDEVSVLAAGGHSPEDLEARRASLAPLLKKALGAPVGTGPYADGVSRMEVTRAANGLNRKLWDYTRAVDADLASALREELREVEVGYRRILRRSGALDFADLLHFARNLVRDRPRARRALQERFQHILVDELQDTDPLQMELVLLLAAADPEARDPYSAELLPGRLTLVGDPKQSIYSFRRADPRLFARARDAILRSGGEVVSLGTSHRSALPIQSLVNRAFGDLVASEGGLPLTGGPPALPGQPALVALPARNPLDFGGKLGREAVRRSHPQTVAAFLAWLVSDSGWQVRDEGGPRSVRASDVCLLFRSVRHQRELATAAYEAELERQGLASVLVGARALHERDEIEALLSVLHALEWPEDELMVYGALRGPFFGFTDEALWAWRNRHGTLHPFRAGDGSDSDLEIRSALEVLRSLSVHRNRRPFAETMQSILRNTRAHVGLGLRPGGARVLDNVQSALDLAREFEESDGFSFRGFVHHLRAAADRPGSTEGTVNEETADGIRMMTVHRAKGLEFPVVVLADPHHHGRGWASEVRRPEDGLLARKIAGFAPLLFLDGQAEASRQATAEVRRLAYVAATRARDLLVVPTVGPHLPSFEQDSWLRPLLRALRPPPGAEAMGAPENLVFGAESYVRPPDARRHPRSIRPGLYDLGEGLELAWWDPNLLGERPQPSFGLAHERFLAEGPAAETGVKRYEAWREAIEMRRELGRSAAVARVDLETPPVGGLGAFSIVERALPGSQERPTGRRYGQLIHRVLADLELDGDPSAARALAQAYGRSLEASPEEIEAAVAAADALSRDELFERARTAARALRRHPVWRDTPEGIVEGTIDLLFEAPEGWIAVDFITGSGGEQAREDALRSRMGHLSNALMADGWPMSIGIVLRV